MKKRKIYGLIVSVGNLTIKDLCNYTRINKKEVSKYVDQLIKEKKVCYSQGMLKAAKQI